MACSLTVFGLCLVFSAAARTTQAWNTTRYDSEQSVQNASYPAEIARYAWPYRHMNTKSTYHAPYLDREHMDLALEMGRTIRYTRLTAYFNVAIWLRANRASGSVLEVSGRTQLMKYFARGTEHKSTDENVMLLHNFFSENSYDYVIVDQVRTCVCG